MTPSEIETVIKKHDRQLSAIEQILPTLATKDDLRIYATKDDLKIYATKADLEEFKTHLSVRIEAVEEKLGTIAEHLADFSPRLPPADVAADLQVRLPA